MAFASSSACARNPLDKDASARETDAAAPAVHAEPRGASPLAGGTVLEPEHLAIKKPGTGLPPDRLPISSAGRLTRAVDRRSAAVADGHRGPLIRIAASHSTVPKRKICVVVTARPSYSRIRTALQRHPASIPISSCSSSSPRRRCSIATATPSRPSSTTGFPIAARVYMVLEGENLVTSAKSTGLGLVELATVFDNLRPDAVVTIADRYETLATAVAASYMNIPVVHVQGGEVTGSIDEKVRHAVTKLVEPAPGRDRRARPSACIRLGEEPDDGRRHRLSVDRHRRRGRGASGARLRPVREVRRRRPDDRPVEGLSGRDAASGDDGVRGGAAAGRGDALRGADFGLPVLWFWPNVDAGSDGTSKGIRVFREREQPANFHFFRNMFPEDFLRLLVHSTAHRRQLQRRDPRVLVPRRAGGEHRLAAAGARAGRNVIDVGHDRAAIAGAHCAARRARHVRRATLYGDGHAGARIAECLAPRR